MVMRVFRPEPIDETPEHARVLTAANFAQQHQSLIFGGMGLHEPAMSEAIVQ
ncbi:hypothetical protein OsJ_35663 [Oryza sativa Japonica Group]|uniref:Uncharacterized protein n=1 Tax=Oryza sativa subsp. japonica TaxID=39947 RepID=B9GCI1_ORYSJ|nr:hypothetical protein OsJ_35663 [Oryza sativa Japonica Group]